MLRESLPKGKARVSNPAIKVAFAPEVDGQITKDKPRLSIPPPPIKLSKQTSDTFTLISHKQATKVQAQAQLPTEILPTSFSPMPVRNPHPKPVQNLENFEDTFRIKSTKPKTMNIDYINNYLNL